MRGERETQRCPRARALGAALALSALAASLVGCADQQPVAVMERTSCVSWKQDIGPLFAARCASCHGGALPAAGIDTSSYVSVLGGFDRPTWAAAGDPGSPLLTTLSIATAPAPHRPLTPLFSIVQSWVVDCRLSYAQTSAHPPGIVNPADPEQFHGVLLQSTGWSFASCAPCHGQDLSGGASGVACASCHQQPVTACATCHDYRMGGAHLSHGNGVTQGKPLQCAECHTQPKDYRDPGHLYNADGSAITAPVQVRFGALAQSTPPSASRKGPPTWTPDTVSAPGTCRNVYCHGAVFVDKNATRTSPTWLADPTQAACGTCHGLPPQSHAPGQTRCYLCHNHTVDAGRSLLSPAQGGLHLNGKVDLGDGSGTCSACHGGAAGPAPPTDVLGGSAVTRISVGAHQAHLLGASHLRGPIPCTDCHVVPASVEGPGHIDDTLPAAVFPPALGGSLARADGAQPLWSHATATCSGVYCHGGGVKLATDLSAGLVRTPLWTQPQGQATCGACHGIPPQDASHDPGMRLIDCVTCHPATMDAHGDILLNGVAGAQTSAHINGVVDVQ